MQVTARLLRRTADGQPNWLLVRLTVDPAGATPASIKQLVHQSGETAAPAADLRCTFAGLGMEDDRLLAAYGIGDGAIIEVVERLSPDGPAPAVKQTIECRFCGSTFDSQASACPTCGALVERMTRRTGGG